MISPNLRPALGGAGDGGDGGGSGAGGSQAPDMLRKTLFIEPEMERPLRREAHVTGMTDAEIVDSLLPEHFGL
jgi:hypothetical protein